MFKILELMIIGMIILLQIIQIYFTRKQMQTVEKAQDVLFELIKGRAEKLSYIQIIENIEKIFMK